MKDDERAANHLAADTFVPMMMEAFHDGLREVASLSRWLLATLVLINGAATISILPLQGWRQVRKRDRLAELHRAVRRRPSARSARHGLRHGPDRDRLRPLRFAHGSAFRTGLGGVRPRAKGWTA